MSKIPTENLFLLEFLVDSITLTKCTESRSPSGEKCVSFQFLDNAPLEICEEDFNPKRKFEENEKLVKCGKSCLFSVTPARVDEMSKNFEVTVIIGAKMDPDCGRDKVLLGVAVIPITDLFNKLVDSVDKESGSSPTAKTLTGEYEILDNNKKMTGKIAVYIRMSCFGKLIVTQFQMNMEDKSVLFKDKEGKSLYRYKKAGS